MKRRGYLIEEIAELNNLGLAFWKAQKGKCNAPDVALFRYSLYANLETMRKKIVSGDVTVGHYSYFKIYDPKERLICAAEFYERVLHHAIMNVCHPYFEKYQVYDSYACRKNKGTYAALDRARLFHKKYAYYLKLDVRKCFDTIDHKVLYSSLCRIFKDEMLLYIFYQIIESYQTKLGKGLPIGNLTSQYFANHIFAMLDHFIKEKLGVKAYVRYMDDMVLWMNDKEDLLRNGYLIKNFIKDGFKQDLKVFCLNKCSMGLPFLGYKIYPHQMRLGNRSKKRYVARLKVYYNFLLSSQWSEYKFQQHCIPLIAYTQKADARNYRIRVMDKIIRQLPMALTA